MGLPSPYCCKKNLVIQFQMIHSTLKNTNQFLGRLSKSRSSHNFIKKRCSSTTLGLFLLEFSSSTTIMAPTPKQKSNTPNPKSATRQGTSYRCATWTTRHLQTGPENTPPAFNVGVVVVHFCWGGEDTKVTFWGCGKWWVGEKGIGNGKFIFGCFQK